MEIWKENFRVNHSGNFRNLRPLPRNGTATCGTTGVIGSRTLDGLRHRKRVWVAMSAPKRSLSSPHGLGLGHAAMHRGLSSAIIFWWTSNSIDNQLFLRWLSRISGGLFQLDLRHWWDDSISNSMRTLRCTNWLWQRALATSPMWSMVELLRTEIFHWGLRVWGFVSTSTQTQHKQTLWFCASDSDDLLVINYGWTHSWSPFLRCHQLLSSDEFSRRPLGQPGGRRWSVRAWAWFMLILGPRSTLLLIRPVSFPVLMATFKNPRADTSCGSWKQLWEKLHASSPSLSCFWLKLEELAGSDETMNWHSNNNDFHCDYYDQWSVQIIWIHIGDGSGLTANQSLSSRMGATGGWAFAMGLPMMIFITNLEWLEWEGWLQWSRFMRWRSRNRRNVSWKSSLHRKDQCLSPRSNGSFDEYNKQWYWRLQNLFWLPQDWLPQVLQADDWPGGVLDGRWSPGRAVGTCYLARAMMVAIQW